MNNQTALEKKGERRSSIRLLIGLAVLLCATLLWGIRAAHAQTEPTPGTPPSTLPSTPSPGTLPEADSERGLLVIAIVNDGAAAEAGIVRGDIILEVEGEAVDTEQELRNAIGRFSSGGEVNLAVLHGDDVRLIAVQLSNEGALGVAVLPNVSTDLLTPQQPQTPVPPFELPDSAPGQNGQSGVLVLEVLPDSAADEAGLQEGDRIVAVDGETLGPLDDLGEIIGDYEAGDTVELTTQRDEPDGGLLERTVEVTLGENEETGGPLLGVRYRGASLPDLDLDELPGLPQPNLPAPERPTPEAPQPDLPELPELPQLPQLPGNTAAPVIASIASDGPAADAELQVGDVIVEVDGSDVATIQDVLDALDDFSPGDTIELTVERAMDDGGLMVSTIEVELGERPDDATRPLIGVTLGGADAPRPVQPQPEPDSFAPLGALIARVQPNSPADRAGLEPGDRIVGIDGAAIAAPIDLVNALAEYAPNQIVVLTVQTTAGDQRQVGVMLGENEETGGPLLGIALMPSAPAEPGDEMEDIFEQP